ncbi:MAG: hypothetical protein AAF388_17285 [Bacteroidota bacterium]
MITFSLVLNIVVLVLVCTGLIMDSDRVKKTAGEFTPGRGVLLAIYLAIAIASVILLFINEPKFVFSLLFMQIVYKVLTPFTVKTFKNPIVISNQAIAAIHLVTVYTMFQNGLIVL